VKVLSLCEYYTGGGGFGPNHFEPYYIVRGVKRDKPMKSSASICVGGRWRTCGTGTEDIALAWAAERFVEIMDQRYRSMDIAVVPIPGSSCVGEDDVEKSRCFALAKETARRFRGDGTRTAEALPLLFWKEARPKSKGMATRNAQKIAEALDSDLFTEIGLERRIVLIDDVVTSGSHIIGCAKYFDDRRREMSHLNYSEVAFAVARTVHKKGQAIRNEYEDCPRPMDDDDEDDDDVT
jgi:hypothetical protein